MGKLFFSGAPILTLLAIIIAIAAYLRQVAKDAWDKLDLIRGNKVWNYPILDPIPEHTLDKIKSLREKTKMMGKVAKIMIYFSIFVIIRIILIEIDSLLPLYNGFIFTLKCVDLIIIVFFFLLFFCLGFFHFHERAKDNKLRIKEEAYTQLHPELLEKHNID